jgi:hypothetical protein
MKEPRERGFAGKEFNPLTALVTHIHVFILYWWTRGAGLAQAV